MSPDREKKRRYKVHLNAVIYNLSVYYMILKSDDVLCVAYWPDMNSVVLKLGARATALWPKQPQHTPHHTKLNPLKH